MSEKSLFCTLGLAALIGLSQPTRADQACTRLLLSSGHNQTVVKGMAPPTDGSDGPCYELAAEAGQTATLSIKGQNVAMTVEDVGDDRTQFRFKTQKRIYKLYPMQTLRSNTGSSFTLTASLR